MDIFLNIILPVAGFFLAVIGAWDKINVGIKYYKLKRSERVIKRAQEEIERIDFYSGDTSYLVAYEFKQLFFLLLVIFFVSLIDVAPPEKLSGNEFRMAVTAVFCWLSGFFVGNAVRVANYVLKAEKLKEKAKRKLTMHELSTNNSMRPVAEGSAD